MRYTPIITAFLVVTVALAGWNKATYAVVNKVQLDAAIMAGKINPKILRKKLKGYPKEYQRQSLDGKWVIFESEKPGDINYLRNRAAQEGIGYTEYTPAEMLVIVKGTNWQEQVQE